MPRLPREAQIAAIDRPRRRDEAVAVCAMPIDAGFPTDRRDGIGKTGIKHFERQWLLSEKDRRERLMNLPPHGAGKIAGWGHRLQAGDGRIKIARLRQADQPRQCFVGLIGPMARQVWP